MKFTEEQWQSIQDEIKIQKYNKKESRVFIKSIIEAYKRTETKRRLEEKVYDRMFRKPF